jgi:hypothetical protein
MSERKYSVQEIERMRSALRWIITPVNQCFYPDEINKQIENQLRTYMLAGTEPNELERRLDEKMQLEQEMQHRIKKMTNP